MNQRKMLLPGVYLRCLETQRFHMGCFSVNFLRELDEADASKNAVLMDVLRRGCESLPDMQSLEAALGDLYGAAVVSSVNQVGEMLAIGFSSVFTDDRYLPEGEQILEKVIDLVGELILNPATKGGLLRADYVNSERENLCMRIMAAINNKGSYAAMRALRLMCEEESYGVYRLGTVESAQRINNQNLTKHYRRVLEESPVEMVYCGSAEPARVEAAVLRAFRALPAGRRVWPATQVKLDCGETRYVTERMDVSQGNLVIGYRLGAFMQQPDFSALSVFNAAFGASANSRLFTEVREKRSLCYSIYSSVDSLKGVLLVRAGIDFDKYDETLEAVGQQLALCARGAVDGEELAAAKRTVANSYRSAEDSPSDLSSFYLRRTLRGLEGSPLELAALVEETKSEEVARVAQSLLPDMVYFLRKEETP